MDIDQKVQLLSKEYFLDPKEKIDYIQMKDTDNREEGYVPKNAIDWAIKNGHTNVEKFLKKAADYSLK